VTPEEVRPDARLRLADAASLSGLTLSGLRNEARRGRLVVWRVAGKDYTSLAEIDRMFEKCRLIQKEPAPRSGPRGSSETGNIKKALAAARETAKKLRNGNL
jgi:hypothetical protein